jgi:rod shape-determining protein MreC
LLLVLLIGMGAILGHLQTMSRNRGGTDIVSLILQKSVMPIALPLGSMFQHISEFGDGVLKAPSLVVQIRNLKSQQVALESYDQRIDLLQEKNDQLRKELSLPNINRQRINLDAIGIGLSDGLLLLNGGSELGIRPDLPVVNGDGLVGVVQSVSKGECRVSLLSTFNLKVGGVDASRTPAEAGMVSGNGGSTLTMLMYTPKAPAVSGDKILTGGLSKNIPAGLVIGRVISVDNDQYVGTRRLTLEPAVNLGTVHEVQVLK